MGEAPEASQLQPRQHMSEESGPQRNGVITLAVDPTRTHLRYATAQPGTATPATEREEYPNLGPYSEELKWFLPLALRWLRMQSTPNRIAFGTTLVWPVGSHEEGYELLNRLLQTVRIDPASRDFYYRVNRPRQMPIGGQELSINRMSSWSVSVLKTFVLSAAGPKSAELPGLYAVQAELDINTPAGRTEALPTSSLESIYRELAAFATQISKEGDVL